MEKNIGDTKKKYGFSDLVTAAVINTKIGQVENKMPGTRGLGTTLVINIKLLRLRIKFLML